MDAQTYPGKGLSLPQLIFAFNEGLKRTMYSPLFTLREVSNLNRDTSAAMVTIREWINSFVPINRLPLDILTIISTHLPSQKDRFRATFVCRHWRRTFLQHAGLWSNIHLSKGEVYVKTLLERARRSPLTILTSRMDPVGSVMLLPPHTKQIADLFFVGSYWVDIRRFLEINPGPLPLLRTLDVSVVQTINPDDTDAVTPPPHPFFGSAIGLKEFRLRSGTPPLLNHFIFPNLTLFELSVTSEESFSGLELLDFLEASPTLRAVCINVAADISLEGVSQERVVVLYHVESFCLAATDGSAGYELATNISCPSVKRTSLTHTREKRHYPEGPIEEFPAPSLLYAIIRQYTRSSIEEITLETKTDSYYLIACSLTFRSADTTIIRLCFEVTEDNEDPGTLGWTFTQMYWNAFLRASRTIQDTLLVADVKRFQMQGPLDLDEEWITYIVGDFEDLFKSLGPLKELTICNCDMRPHPFVRFAKLCGVEAVYPPIKALTIWHPSNICNVEFVEDLVGLAKAQHELGVPFEHVTVHMHNPPAEMEEMLRLWVGTVDCRGLL